MWHLRIVSKEIPFFPLHIKIKFQSLLENPHFQVAELEKKKIVIMGLVKCTRLPFVCLLCVLCRTAGSCVCSTVLPAGPLVSTTPAFRLCRPSLPPSLSLCSSCYLYSTLDSVRILFFFCATTAESQ